MKRKINKRLESSSDDNEIIETLDPIRKEEFLRI
jgi:hypothetical protein